MLPAGPARGKPRAAHGALAFPPYGTAGQTAGAGVRRAPTNLSTRSFDAVEGGLPDVFAGASAHHWKPVPIVMRTATRPCDGSFSVYAQLPFPPRTRSRLPRTVTRVTASVDAALLYL